MEGVEQESRWARQRRWATNGCEREGEWREKEVIQRFNDDRWMRVARNKKEVAGTVMNETGSAGEQGWRANFQILTCHAGSDSRANLVVFKLGL